MTRYCVDCLHFRKADLLEFGKCAKSATTSPDALVSPTLADRVNLFYASTMRGSDDRCGPDGKWFEPRGAVVPPMEENPELRAEIEGTDPTEEREADQEQADRAVEGMQ